MDHIESPPESTPPWTHMRTRSYTQPSAGKAGAPAPGHVHTHWEPVGSVVPPSPTWGHACLSVYPTPSPGLAPSEQLLSAEGPCSKGWVPTQTQHHLRPPCWVVERGWTWGCAHKPCPFPRTMAQNHCGWIKAEVRPLQFRGRRWSPSPVRQAPPEAAPPLAASTPIRAHIPSFLLPAPQGAQAGTPAGAPPLHPLRLWPVGSPSLCPSLRGLTPAELKGQWG